MKKTTITLCVLTSLVTVFSRAYAAEPSEACFNEVRDRWMLKANFSGDIATQWYFSEDSFASNKQYILRSPEATFALPAVSSSIPLLKDKKDINLLSLFRWPVGGTVYALIQFKNSEDAHEIVRADEIEGAVYSISPVITATILTADERHNWDNMYIKEAITNIYKRMILGANNQYTAFLDEHLAAPRVWKRERTYAIEKMQGILNKLKANPQPQTAKIRAVEDYIAQLKSLVFSYKTFIAYYPEGDAPKRLNQAKNMFYRLESALNVCTHLYTMPSDEDAEMLKTFTDAQKFVHAEDTVNKLLK